jgi:hypothetical protein
VSGHKAATQHPVKLQSAMAEAEAGFSAPYKTENHRLSSVSGPTENPAEECAAVASAEAAEAVR